MSTRRQFSSSIASLLTLSLAGVHRYAGAQQAETARLLVGFPPGGSTDNVARRLAEKLRGSYAANVIVDNRPGAGTQIAVATAKESAPDGTSILLSPPAPFSIYPFTYRKLPYGPDDLVPVSLVCTFPFAFAVGPAVPGNVKSINDFIAWAKANPSKANFGSPAAGSTPHLIGSLLGMMNGVDLTHVAYRGDAPGLQDLMGGQVSGYSTVLGSFLPHIKSDRLRLLAVSGTARNPFAPELPTYREQGHALDMTEWFGVFLPAKTPSAVVQKLASQVKAAVAQPDFVKALAEFGMSAKSSSPAELTAQLRTETDQWRGYVKQIGFTADT